MLIIDPPTSDSQSKIYKVSNEEPEEPIEISRSFLHKNYLVRKKENRKNIITSTISLKHNESRLSIKEFPCKSRLTGTRDSSLEKGPGVAGVRAECYEL
jgi:hypothetical protein